jgi:hypothetical protein
METWYGINGQANRNIQFDDLKKSYWTLNALQMAARDLGDLY